MSQPGIYSAVDELVLLDPATDEAWHLPLVKAPDGAHVNVSRLGAYPPKQVIGDFTRTSHEVLSSYVQSDTTGGGQVRDSVESTDQGRFWWATADTRWPQQVALPPLATALPAPAGQAVARLLGDFGDTNALAAYDTTLCSLSLTGPTVLATLAGAPVGRGATFKGTLPGALFFIPLGSAGYQTWNGTTLSAVSTAAKPIDLMEWDNKLYALQADGQLLETTDGAAWTTKVTLDASHTPRFLVDFFTRQGDPALHIVTHRAVFGVDLTVPAAYRTQLAPPPHPDAALAGCVWRTDLYVSYGLGVNRYTGDTISAAGLDRDHGLPKEYRGAIVAMASGYNELYALVRGTSVGATPSEAFITDLTDQDPAFAPTAVPTVLMVWNGFGWHTLWVSPVAGVAYDVTLSTAQNTYRLYWSQDGTVYGCDLPRTFYNPRERDGTEPFAPAAQIVYSTLDMNMTGSQKIYASLELRTRDTTPTETVTVDYRLDAGDWQTLGVITDPGPDGMTTLRLGAHGLFPDGRARYDGIGGDRITIRLTLARGDDATKTPLVESMGIVFHKVMGQLNAYQVTVNCTSIDLYDGKTARERQLFLDRMVSSHLLVPMQHQGVWRSVRFVGVSGRDRTGLDFGGDRVLSLVEALEA